MRYTAIALCLAVIVLVFAVGCTTAPVQVQPTIPMVPQKERVNIDPALLEDCDQYLDAMPDRTLNQKDFLDQAARWNAQYQSCRRNHQSLAEVVRKAFNMNADLALAIANAHAPDGNPTTLQVPTGSK
ncbi:hypothetical protein [Burkholderia phage BCSR5]|nr:hypothetical protein [Burkholderia phage BCSR5]